MKSVVEQISPLERKLNVSVPAQIVQDTFTRVFKDIQKNAQLKGFRPGKAPMQTVKSVYQSRAMQDVVEHLVSRAWSEAVREHKLEPINRPEFEFDAPSENAEFQFSAFFEIRPEVKLTKYEGLEVTKEKLQFDEKKVDAVLENMRQSGAQKVEISEKRPAKVGDFAVFDFDGTTNGKPLENGKATDFELELGSKSFIEGFEEGIVGMEIGAEKILQLKFPDPYHAKELAGQPVEFKVTLKQLKEKQLPELTDEYIKNIGGKDTLEGLKGRVREDLLKQEEKRIEQEFRDRLLKKLVQENPIPVPKTLVTQQKEALIEDLKKRMTEQGFGDKDFEDYKSKWDQDFLKTATEMVQAGFLIDAISRKHELVWTDEDFEKKVSDGAKQMGLEAEKIRDFYNRPEQFQRITYMITEDKVVNFLTTKAKVDVVDKAKIKDA